MTVPATTRYLNLIEAVLTGQHHRDPQQDPWSPAGYDEGARAVGRDWPTAAMTMIGGARMRSLRHMCETVLAEEIPGDLIETGVWRGGACIYMRAILEACGDAHRRVFLADSFEGLPPPDASSYPADAGAKFHTFQCLAVPLSEVQANFKRFDLLDERVVFLKGWFKFTLPTAPIDRLAILRLDGDMYESTMQALEALYPKVSPGGYVIVDDYHLTACARAVTDYRERHQVSAPILPIDGFGSWWRVA